MVRRFIRPYTHMGILQLSIPGDMRSFKRLLNKNQANRRISGRLFDILTNERNDSDKCKSVIVENEYVDRDYVDAYSRLLARAFMDYPTRCTRVHFFSTELQPQDFADSSKEHESFLQKHYLGFSVLRPTFPQTFGRTIIKAPSFCPEKYFNLVKTKFPVNLAGIQLEIEGTPFIEQDRQVSACATAALWAASTACFNRFGLGYYSTSEITDIATSINVEAGRSFPSEGLTVAQITWALRSMGYDPIVYEDFSYNDAKHTIYTYIESGIPVICGIEIPNGSHAIAVVGHTYDPNSQPDLDQNLQVYKSSEWVPSFICHDDQLGPYRVLKLYDGPYPCPITLDTATSARTGASPVEGRLFTLIIPLPKQVFVNAAEAELKHLEILLYGWENLFQKDLPSDTVIRTYMIPSNEFKNSLPQRSSKLVPIPQMLDLAYRGLPLSRYVWVTEFGNIGYRTGKSSHELLIDGEILSDTASGQLRLDFLVAHFPGHLLYMARQDKSIMDAFRSGWMVLQNSPYYPLLRNV